ncbi:hypothetical protein OAO01_06010 [Oligoflexia bacterium]|nr:hypothetical protein [Oligoflexia bacterium]
MNKICDKCASEFEISNDDSEFYTKVSPQVKGERFLIPPPSLCPICRNQRRMSWRNDRTFYHRTCALSGRSFISIYHPDCTAPVLFPSEWHSDQWDGLEYGRNFDFSRPFFEQFTELQSVVPRLGIVQINCENSDYCNHCTDLKNCYLDIGAQANEDCYYNQFVKYSKSCVDCMFVYRSTLCYECVNCHNCYNTRFSQYLENCSDCSFCFDLKGCSNCLFCNHLRNQNYCVENTQYAPEEYRAKLQELKLDSDAGLKQSNLNWHQSRLTKGVYRDMYTLNSEASTGNDIKNCYNCQGAFNAVDCEDCKYIYDVMEARDCYDLNYSLYHPEVCYELISSLQAQYSAFCMASFYSSNMLYCDLIYSSHNLFGCVGLRQKQYCFLNQQYSESEYQELIPRVIAHMRDCGEWGQFFPARYSLFGYNETIAHEYYPLAQETAVDQNFHWRQKNVEVAKRKDPPLTSEHVSQGPGITTSKLHSCAGCGKNFRVINQEAEFYKEMELPLPTICSACRHLGRVALRNPRRLWQRLCNSCDQPITTSFPPHGTEQIYCEKCYHQYLYGDT